MTDRIADSALYRHLWGTDEARAVLGEEGRLRGWLEVITALARVQAEAGLIPARAAELIAEHARADRIDLAYAAEQTRQASHSMLGLIRALQAVLPEQARDFVYAGATVQDITDTWTALALRRIGGLVWRDLRRIEERLLELAAFQPNVTGLPGCPWVRPAMTVFRCPAASSSSRSSMCRRSRQTRPPIRRSASEVAVSVMSWTVAPA